MKKFLNKYYGAMIAGVALLGIAILVFFLIWPFKVAEFKQITVTNKVSVGGLLEYTNDYCQSVSKGTDRDITRFLVAKDPKLVNPIELSSNPTDETLQDAGCRTSTPVKLPIDSSVPAGDYKLLVKACYYVFFHIRCVNVTGESDYFTISKPDILGQLTNINTQLESINGYLKTDPTYVPTQPNPSVSNVAPSTVTDTPQTNSSPPTDSTPQQRSGILQGTIDTINGILHLGL